MDDLIAVAAKQELPPVLESGDGQAQFRVGDVLDLVDDQEVILGHGLRAALPGHEVRVEEAGVRHVGAPALENPVDRAPLLAQEDRLPDAQGQILLFVHPGGTFRRAADDPLDLLEDAMRLAQLEDGADPAIPRSEVGEGRLAARRHLDGLNQFNQRQEVDLLRVIGVPVGEVERSGIFDQIGRAGEIKAAAVQGLQLLQGQRGFAASRGADDDQRKRRLEDRGLGIVERERLVEHVNRSGAGVHVAKFLPVNFGRRGRRRGIEVGLAEAAAIEEAGLRVVVIANHFEDEEKLASRVLGQLKQEAIFVVELRPVDARVLELLDLGRPEVSAPELLKNLLVLPLDVARVEVSEDQCLHRNSGLNGRCRLRRTSRPLSVRPIK